MTEFQENSRRDGRTDKQTLFYWTLLLGSKKNTFINLAYLLLLKSKQLFCELQYFLKILYLAFKTWWPLFMDGVQLPQGYSHFEEAVYFLPFSSQKFLVLISFPRKHERLSRPWSNPVVLNTELLDWESSALTTRPLNHSQPWAILKGSASLNLMLITAF